MPWIADRKSLWAATCFVALAASAPVSAAESLLVLEIMINGRATGRVGEFIKRDSGIYASAEDLRQLGLIVPSELIRGSDPIALSSLPNLRADVDEVTQTLVVLASDNALTPTELQVDSAAGVAPLSPAGLGVLLNYDVALTFSAEHSSGGAFLDVRAFAPLGVLESSAIVDVSPSSGRQGFVRLDTSFTHTQASKMRRWRIGDLVTSALPWTRAVRLGGVQVASDFAIRPDLITYPLPVISGSAAVPSTVNVMVNGISQLSEAVQPGPFAVRTLPVVTGAGEVTVAMVDALGRQTLITLPFYASTALLKRGLGSYSIELGSVRDNYGQSGDHYSGLAITQSSRFGLTDWLTLESHAEASRGLGLLGGGVAMRAGTLGILNIAAAGSIGRSPVSDRSSGGMVAAGFQRLSTNFNLSLNGSFYSAGYKDIASNKHAPLPKLSLNASLGFRVGDWGNFGIAYTRRDSRAADPDEAGEERTITDPQVELVTASYGVRIGGAALYATGFKDLRNSRAYGLGMSINFASGRSTHATIGGSLDSGRPSTFLTLASSAQEHGQYGYRLHYADGDSSRLSAETEYLNRWGRVSGGVEYSSGQIAGRLGARGALVLADGGVFVSDQISDSFAVVSSGDVAGVPVLYENRLVGMTDSRGKLLISYLLSFQDNRLSIDTAGLAPDVEVGQSDVIVRPPDRSGVKVEFAVKKVQSALLTLHDRDGQPLPLGAVAQVDGAGDRPVGHDGETYVTGLKTKNRLGVLLPDGTRCAVEFDYRPAPGDIPLIGPLRCI